MPALDLFHFFMPRMLPAGIAKLPRLQPLGMLLAVLHSGVIAIFAIPTLQCNDLSHVRLSGILIAAAAIPIWRRRLKSCVIRYSMISVTAPAPTVWPPSRIANRSPFSNATGVINATSIDTLSPGITISTPVGSFTSPVTSVVRK